MIKLEASTIPSDQQRYPTVGDYWEKDSIQHFRVSDMGNKDFEFLVLLHELIEQHMTEREGITEQSISDYDEYYEEHRTPESLDEPGDNLDAPYYRQHQIATAIERTVATFLGVDWNEYDEAVESL